MLTQTLRELERSGLVRRTVHPETPPRVVYGLLPLGHSLAERLVPVAEWVEEHSGSVLEARAAFDESRCPCATD
jgi:DNA-binding HxlR family transcriptional regulator